MKNLLEIPQNAKKALLIIEVDDNNIHCIPVHGKVEFHTSITMLLGSFTAAIKSLEKDNGECVPVRSLLQVMTLEEAVAALTDASRAADAIND